MGCRNKAHSLTVLAGSTPSALLFFRAKRVENHLSSPSKMKKNTPLFSEDRDGIRGMDTSWSNV